MCHTVHLFPSRDIHNYHNIFLSRSFSANNFFDADGIGGGWEADSSAENYEQCFWPNGFNKIEKCTSLLTAHGTMEHSYFLNLIHKIFTIFKVVYTRQDKKDGTVSRIHHPTIVLYV